MSKLYKITWIEIIPEIFNYVPDVDKFYKLSNKTCAKIVQLADKHLRFDFCMSPDYYELEISDNPDCITYEPDKVDISSPSLFKFVESQLQNGSDNIILPLLESQ